MIQTDGHYDITLTGSTRRAVQLNNYITPLDIDKSVCAAQSVFSDQDLDIVDCGKKTLIGA